MLTLHETLSIHDSINRPKIEFTFYYKYKKFKIIHILGNSFYLICNHINCFIGV